jgi:hypothetical protein
VLKGFLYKCLTKQIAEASNIFEGKNAHIFAFWLKIPAAEFAL